MKKVRLTESDLKRIVKRVISEQNMGDERMVNLVTNPLLLK